MLVLCKMYQASHLLNSTGLCPKINTSFQNSVVRISKESVNNLSHNTLKKITSFSFV